MWQVILLRLGGKDENDKFPTSATLIMLRIEGVYLPQRTKKQSFLFPGGSLNEEARGFLSQWLNTGKVLGWSILICTGYTW